MAEAVERAKLNRRLFLQLSAASLAAGGLHVALERPALAEVPDPASEDPDLIIIDGLTEAANDPDVQQYIRTGALPFWIAGIFVNTWRNNLDFMTVPRDLVDYYRRAGVASRDLAGAQSIWETIPREVRMAGPRALRRFHSSRDWSHFIPRSLGGGHSASEGIFEDRWKNQVRGPNPMTPDDIEAARKALRTQALVQTVRSTATVALSGALVGTVIAGVFAVMEYGLQYHEGKISRARLYELVWKRLSVEAAVAVGIAGIIAGLAILFPPLMAVISAFALPLTFATFALVGYQFYAAAKTWKEAGFDPLLGAWDTSKEISSEAWERAGTLFEEFQNDAESAWAETKEVSQSIWGAIQVGAGGITLNAGTLRQWISNWFNGTFSPVEICDYSIVKTYDYVPVEICD